MCPHTGNLATISSVRPSETPAWVRYGCRPHHIQLQAPSHAVTGSITYGCRWVAACA